MSATPTRPSALPPGARLCAGLLSNAQFCPRLASCARHTEIETTPGAVVVWANVCADDEAFPKYIANGVHP